MVGPIAVGRAAGLEPEDPLETLCDREEVGLGQHVGLLRVAFGVGLDGRLEADLGDPERDVRPLLVGREHLAEVAREAQVTDFAALGHGAQVLVGMDADEVEVVGGAGLDHRVQEAHVEVGDAQADLRVGIDLLGRVVRRHHQLGVVLHLVLRVAEAAVELVPDLPVLDVVLVAPHRAADVVAPVLDVLDRELARPAVGRGPGGEVAEDTPSRWMLLARASAAIASETFQFHWSFLGWMVCHSGNSRSHRTPAFRSIGLNFG